MRSDRPIRTAKINPNSKVPSPPMKTNVGGIDRALRIVLGLAIIGAGIYLKSFWGLIGLVPLLTATLRFCPLYAPLGLSTCPLDRK
jgi:ABC-type microcin C transport system permease subunit YejE